MWKHYIIIRCSEKSQNRQCLGFCTADFCTSFAYESAEQKPKHCLTWDFLSALVMTKEAAPLRAAVDVLGSLGVPMMMMLHCHNSTNPLNFLQTLTHSGYSQTRGGPEEHFALQIAKLSPAKVTLENDRNPNSCYLPKPNILLYTNYSANFRILWTE